MGTLNAPSLSLSNLFPLEGSFVGGIPEGPGGLLGTLCKRTLTVGPGAWGLRCCGPDIAGDSGLRHAPAGAPCKGHDRPSAPLTLPRAPAPASAAHALPFAAICPWPPGTFKSLGTPSLLVLGRP